MSADDAAAMPVRDRALRGHRRPQRPPRQRGTTPTETHEPSEAPTMSAILLETTDRVLLATLNRPQQLNAFNGELFDGLAQTFIDAATDDSVRVLLLTGAGRAFTAGADLTEMARPGAPQKHGFAGLCRAIVDFPKPFVLAVNGLGTGLGATICGLADFTYMAASARLRCPFSTLGLTAEAGSTFTFPLLMGRQRAAWFLMASEWLSAADCVHAGLALDVLPDDALMAHARAKAAQLAALPPASLATTKKLMLAPMREQLLQAIDAENAALAKLVGGPANREALRAFAEKRQADFSAL
jgi:enoyl-CoA hydratase/carnithine racemase